MGRECGPATGEHGPGADRGRSSSANSCSRKDPVRGFRRPSAQSGITRRSLEQRKDQTRFGRQRVSRFAGGEIRASWPRLPRGRALPTRRSSQRPRPRSPASLRLRWRGGIESAMHDLGADGPGRSSSPPDRTVRAHITTRAIARFSKENRWSSIWAPWSVATRPTSPAPSVWGRRRPRSSTDTIPCWELNDVHSRRSDRHVWAGGRRGGQGRAVRRRLR